jgi:hypothetical protein
MGGAMQEQYDDRAATNPQVLAARAEEAFTSHAQPGGHGSHDHSDAANTTIREVRHKGHRIRIETTYRITVDGRPVGGHIEVNNAGRVHYHSIPNQEFESAVDMVKRIVDLAQPAQMDQPVEPHHHH